MALKMLSFSGFEGAVHLVDLAFSHGGRHIFGFRVLSLRAQAAAQRHPGALGEAF